MSVKTKKQRATVALRDESKIRGTAAVDASPDFYLRTGRNPFDGKEDLAAYAAEHGLKKSQTSGTGKERLRARSAKKIKSCCEPEPTSDDAIAAVDKLQRSSSELVDEVAKSTVKVAEILSTVLDRLDNIPDKSQLSSVLDRAAVASDESFEIRLRYKYGAIVNCIVAEELVTQMELQKQSVCRWIKSVQRIADPQMTTTPPD